MAKTLNLLILEDNSTDAELLLIELRRGGYMPDYQIVDNEKDFVAHLKPDLDLILSDYNLPQFNGLQALQLRNESGYDIPFIIVSGAIGERLAVECMREGADDYLMKDRLGRLGAAVDNAIRNKKSRDEQKQAQQEIELLLDLSRQAGTETNLDNLLFFIANKIIETISPAEAVSVFLYEEKRKVVKVQAWAGSYGFDVDRVEFEIADGQVGRIFRTKKPALIRDVSNDPDFQLLDIPGIRKIKSQIIVPLIFKERVIGIIYADNLTRTDAFSQKNLDLLESIGNQLAGVIENARLLENIRQSENRLLKAQQVGHLGFVEWKLKTNQVLLSDETCIIHGFKPQEGLATHEQIMKAIHPDDREFVQKSIDALIRDGGKINIDHRIVLPDGEVRWINKLVEIIHDVDGSPGTILGTVLDITERKSFTHELQMERDKAQEYLDIAEVMIVALNRDGEITLVNQKGASILGYQIEDLTGKNWFDTCVLKSDKKRAKKVFNDFIAGEAAWGEHFEQIVVTKSGEERIIDWHSTPLWEWDDKEKRRIGSLSSGEDITERKQAEQMLKQEQEKAQKYLDVAGVLMLVLNKKGEITLVNQKGCQILGYQEDELIGADWFNTCLPEKSKERVKKIFKRITAGKIKSFEYVEGQILTKSGEERIIAWHNTVLQDEKGHNIGLLSSGEDITRRNRAEQLLKALNQAAVAMGTAQTHQDIFNAVAEELEQLGISCMIFLIDEIQDKLFTKYISYESALINAAEKLAGIKYENFSFPIDTVDLFREVTRDKKTLFSDSSKQAFQQILSKMPKKILAQIMKLLRVQKFISAPLIVGDQVIGVFSIQSDILTQENVPTATAFADQLSSAWNKIGLLHNLRKTVEGTIHAIAATVEVRDPYTAGHQGRVADLAVAISKEMGLSKDQIESIRMAGLIHDLGKINVPAEILSKPGTLSELEFNLIKTHPQVGFDLLKEIEFPWPIAEMVLQHHEKMDGSGYPQGLKGEDILLEARILTVADIVEAISSHRPYRPSLGIEKALAQIKKDRGALLNPGVVDVCLKIFKEGYKLPEN